MIGILIELFIGAVIIGISLAILGAFFSFSCIVTFIKGFFTNIQLVDSCMIFFLIFLSLTFVLGIHIVISGIIALIVAFAIYKIMDSDLGYLIFSILFSPGWAFAFAFIFHLFNKQKVYFGVIFASILIISLVAHYKQREDLFILGFPAPDFTFKRKPKSKKVREKKPKIKKVKVPKSDPITIEPDIIIGKTDNDEQVEIEIINDEEYETYRWVNNMYSKKKYS